MRRPSARFFLAVAFSILAALQAAEAVSPDALPTSELVAEIVRRMDARESAAELIQPAADRGMVLARACAEAFDPAKPYRQEALCNLIAMAARCRQQHREVLRLYDPAAFETFYSEQAEKEQERYALILRMNPWPRQGASALIHAAPLPLLKWMNAQASAAEPDLSRLYGLWAQWGADIQFAKERQHLDAVRALAAEFLKNARIAGETRALSAAIRFAGESGARGAAETLVRHLAHADPLVRVEAVRALQRVSGIEPPAALLELSQKERDVRVQQALAESFQEWGAHAAAGAAALALFQRCETVEVRRALVYSAARAAWPQRADILAAAFDAGDGSVLGAALQAIGEKPAPELAAKTRVLMAAYPEPPPPLIDALGGLREPKAAPYLIAALRAAQNPAVRLKIVLSLERIGGNEAAAELAEQLKTTANVAFAQQAAAALGRMKATQSAEALALMAEDTTAPLAVRMQCIWSLGMLPVPAALASLKKMDGDPQHYFGRSGADTPASQNEKAEQCRLILKMALFQQGEKSAEDAAVQIYRTGSPTTRVTMLMMLAQLKRDHPVIADGLASEEYAVVLAAVNAAGAAGGSKYKDRVAGLRDAPFVRAILEANLNPGGMQEALRKAQENAEAKP